MKYTIDDTRKFISNIYMWLTTNDDLDYIESCVMDCSSEEYMSIRCKLNAISKDSRVALNKVAEYVDETDSCMRILRMAAERERGIRKEKKMKKKLKKRERNEQS